MPGHLLLGPFRLWHIRGSLHPIALLVLALDRLHGLASLQVVVLSPDSLEFLGRTYGARLLE